MARWQEVVYKIGVFWILIPASVGAVGYFTVAWLTSREEPLPEAKVEASPPVEQPMPRAKGEKWTMPDPPQVEVFVEKVEEGTEPPRPEEEAKPVEIEVPEGEEIDEAGVGGFVRPPSGESDDEGAGFPGPDESGGESSEAEEPGGVFRGEFGAL